MLKRLLFLCFLLPATLNAQTAQAFEKAGYKAYEEKDYYTAIYYLEAADDLNEGNPQVVYIIAESARQFYAFNLAVEQYTRLLELEGSSAFPLARFHLAEVYKQLGNYELAAEYYQAFLNTGQGETSYLAKAQEEIATCQWAQEQVAGDSLYTTTLLSDKVNTPYSEFGPYLYGDTLFYSSYRFRDFSDKKSPLRKISKVMTVQGDEKGRAMSKKFNSNTQLTAHTTLSSNQKTIYFTICNYTQGMRFRCEIFARDKTADNLWAETPRKLSDAINTVGFTATQPSVGFDNKLQREVLYFASDRPGGEGGLDIWRSVFDPVQQQFGAPQPVAAVNTEADEVTPFWHASSQTLYFSSKGYQGLGGYDVYRIAINDPYAEVSHLATSINSSYNDLYFAPQEDARYGYFSSNRPGGYYLDKKFKACCNDIYTYEWVGPERLPITLTPLPVAIPLLPIPERLPDWEYELEQLLPLALYFDNDRPNPRTRQTTTRKAYLETYAAYYARRGEYITNYSEPVQEARKEEAKERVETFFDDRIKRGADNLARFSNILVLKLQRGERLDITLQGYASPRAKGDYNKKLSQRRASCIRNHFNTFRNGIFQPYLKNKQLTITEQGFGERDLKDIKEKDISDDLDDRRNSVYSPTAARERRVEIVEVETKQ
ncbi:MAG: hypothetical protein AAF798_17675 [Bacteroidota bacterium]